MRFALLLRSMICVTGVPAMLACGKKEHDAEIAKPAAAARTTAATTKPPTAVASADASPTAPPVNTAPAAAPCVSATAAYDLHFDGSRARLCGEGDSPCVQVSADGAVSAVAPPAPTTDFPRTTLEPEPSADDQINYVAANGVKVCKDSQRCLTLERANIRDVWTSADGSRVVVLSQEDETRGSAIELFDPSKNKPLACRVAEWDDHHGVRYDLSSVGEFVLWRELPGASTAANAALWSTAGDKLAKVSDISGAVYSHAASRGHLIFTGHDPSAQLHDRKTGRPTGTLDLSSLVVGDEEAAAFAEDTPEIWVAAHQDTAAFALITSAAARVMFAPLPSGASKTVSLPLCK